MPVLGFPEFDLNNLSHVFMGGKDTGALDSLVK